PVVHPVSRVQFWASVERQTWYAPLRSCFALVTMISDEVPAAASMIRPKPGSSMDCHWLASLGARSSTLTSPLAVGADPMARKPSCVAISLSIPAGSGMLAVGNGVGAAEARSLGTGDALPSGVAVGCGVAEATARTNGSFTRPLPTATAAPTTPAS